MDQSRLLKGQGPIGLILVPTRELALQIYRQVAHVQLIGVDYYFFARKFKFLILRASLINCQRREFKYQKA